MRKHNSRNNQFYTGLLVSIHHDMVGAISPQSEIVRDADEIRRRVLHEGEHFLTKVLPALGKSIDVSLATGTPLSFTGFKTGKGTRLPAFMQTVFGRVFRYDGVPWFATWYSDFCTQIQSDPEMDVPLGTQASEHINRETVRDVLAAIAKAQPGYEIDWTGTTFPGLHHLHEVWKTGSNLLSAISVGRNPARTLPDDSDVVLNSRREAMVVALRALRQVCYSFYKLNIPYSDEQESKVLEDFVSVDAGLDYHKSKLSGKQEIILRRARALVCMVVGGSDPLSGRPRHGPGAVATGERSSEKHTFRRFYKALDRVFKYDEWFYYNSSHLCDSLQELQSLEPLEAGTAKVVLVPKDSRGPRLISCEPLEYQWIQQSIMAVLVDAIESNPLTRGFVNFRDQQVNRNLAAEGSSAPYSVVTLDMKEASDRVSLELVKDLFPSNWYEALYASRSPQTRLPDGRLVTMKKFAPMGSAVCFPVEALVFWALCVSAVQIENENRGLPKGPTTVFVYGDDIVCGAYYHGALTDMFPHFGLMLNVGKCCSAGPFKESCGMDAFFGQPVTPTKIRSEWCDTPKSSNLASYVAYANAFYRDGLFETAQYIRSSVQGLLTEFRMPPIPTIGSGDPSVMAFVRPDVNVKLHNHPRFVRYNRRYQRMEVLGYTCVPKSEMTRDEGWNLLTRLMAPKETKKEEGLLSPLPAQTLKTGQYAIVHRNKLTRTWTPLA